MAQKAAVLSVPHDEISDVPQGEVLLTVGEVAGRLRVNTTTVRRWIVSGTLEALVLPHRGKRHGYRIRQSTLDRILHVPVTTIQ